MYNAISPIIRKNATNLYVFKLRNYKDLEALLEELSALYDKQTVLEICKIATEDPHSFLFVDLTAKSIRDMFYKSLKQKLIPQAAHVEEA